MSSMMIHVSTWKNAVKHDDLRVYVSIFIESNRANYLFSLKTKDVFQSTTCREFCSKQEQDTAISNQRKANNKPNRQPAARRVSLPVKERMKLNMSKKLKKVGDMIMVLKIIAVAVGALLLAPDVAEAYLLGAGGGDAGALRSTTTTP